MKGSKWKHRHIVKKLSGLLQGQVCVFFFQFITKVHRSWQTYLSSLGSKTSLTSLTIVGRYFSAAPWGRKIKQTKCISFANIKLTYGFFFFFVYKYTPKVRFIRSIRFWSIQFYRIEVDVPLLPVPVTRAAKLRIGGGFAHLQTKLILYFYI